MKWYIHDYNGTRSAPNSFRVERSYDDLAYMMRVVHAGSGGYYDSDRTVCTIFIHPTKGVMLFQTARIGTDSINIVPNEYQIGGAEELHKSTVIFKGNFFKARAAFRFEQRHTENYKEWAMRHGL